ncbi:cell agglutination protein Mam3 [Scheffersomyces spartinae]|uniref:Cell agglutination protein Mam3 n=1 Tax=Scheffersomyces spartinae TaxID=45513 RepID=A0A9P7V5K9_9ASCO|nr:cell agglutination protein Mam3 [Scheffersomyces spartinae]KAG7191580.1 cell agglutination protein Mam3 [Scheffersomyces spartinae]
MSLAQEPMTSEEFYINLATSVCLVLAGGVFAGLTLGLMGQDEVYLKVIATSGEPIERKHARKVLRLINRGKHWVLVTLLLSNVITNETLPIVLDRCLGGGWPAVVASTAAIVVFGEIIPQSISVRYGLQVGSMFAPFVLILMYIMYPIAYPIAMLLDYLLGEDHGTVYKKSGLKTLVTLHKTMGVERLNQDEVTIISAVLDLKEKPVSAIMTPIDRVYTMSADTVLDEKTVDEIFQAGFSRIPVHLPNEPLNFIGMLLVRVLISYDPEDALTVASFPLATLPETSADTSCLNILNYFQEGKSHMIVVSEHPGEPLGALGVLTLEDVIEELIGEEIVDESDVYVDINKNIKRKIPGPLSKRNLTQYLHTLYQNALTSSKRNSIDNTVHHQLHHPNPQYTLGGDPGSGSPYLAAPYNTNSPLLQAVDSSKNWIPRNPASNPLETNKTFVTIKKPVGRLHSATNLTPNGSPGAGGNIYHPQSPLGKLTANNNNGNNNQNNSSTGSPSIHDQVIPAPDRPAPGNGYGAIHLTEEGALRHAADIDSGVDHQHQFQYGAEEGENNSSQGGMEIPEGFQYENLAHQLFRSSGIVESVVNVQGVHKTIIEHYSGNEDNGDEVDLLLLNEDVKRKKKKKKSKKLQSKSKKKQDSPVSGSKSELDEGFQSSLANSVASSVSLTTKRSPASENTNAELASGSDEGNHGTRSRRPSVWDRFLGSATPEKS